MSSPTAIGIDFGGTTIKSAIVRDGAIIGHGETIDTVKAGDSSHIEQALIGGIAAMRQAHPDIVAIGVGLPGIIDSVNGIVHRLSNVPGWNETPLRDFLRTNTGLHAIIENDAKSMAYAEWKYGAARNGRNVVCVTLGTGVGGGIILEGKLYRGSFLGAGEIGQTSIDYQGVPGNYGNLGAIEKYVGNHQIAQRAQKLYADAGKTMSLEDCSPAKIDIAARAGDPVACGLWKQLGLELGVALANVVWLLNPDVIVIGGGVAKANELLFDPIRATIQAVTMPTFYKELKILPAALGNDAGMIGSASIALDTLPAQG